MFEIGTRVFYPKTGYGVGTILEVKREENIQGELGTPIYKIEWQNGNTCNLYENKSLIALNPTEEEEYMGKAVPKPSARLKGKKVLVGKAVEKMDEPKDVKVASPKAPKHSIPEGWKTLKQAHDEGLDNDAIYNGLHDGSVEGKQFGRTWYYNPASYNAK